MPVTRREKATTAGSGGNLQASEEVGYIDSWLHKQKFFTVGIVRILNVEIWILWHRPACQGWEV